MTNITKHVFGGVVVVTVAGMQLFAWHSGLNGQVFAFTSLIIGLTAGSILGFSFATPLKKGL